MPYTFLRLLYWMKWYDVMDTDDRKYSPNGLWAFQNIVNLCHAVAARYPLKASKDDISKAKPENVIG